MVAWMEHPPTRKVIHVDRDACFASIEQRDNPALAFKTARAFGRTVKVKFADFRLATRSRTSPGTVGEHAQLCLASLHHARSVFPAETGTRLVGATVSKFETPVREDNGLPLFRCAAGRAGAQVPVPAGLA